MKILMAVAATVSALAMIGCVDLAEKDELDDVSAKLTKLSAQIAQKNDMQTMFAEELVKRTNGLEKKVGEMDILVNTMKSQVEGLEDLTKTLRATIEQLSKAQPAGTANPGQPASEQAKALKIEDILLEVQTVLSELRSGKVKTDEAATRLKPWAHNATPILVTELRGSLTRFEYAKQLETILGRFPPAELKVPLQGGLRQRGIREAATRVIGATGDKDLSKLLEEYLAEGDEDFRLAVGEALVRCRNGTGIPLLLFSLKSDQSATRTIAISALKKINRGEDLGYKPQLTPEANAAAIKAWDEWSDKFAKTLFE